MGSFPLRWVAACAVFLACGGTAAAQEFRVFTQLSGYPRGDVREEPQPLSRSLTLYHAGLVYDFVGDADEVTVFDPANRRFVILNTARGLATTIGFDQLSEMIERSRAETASYAANHTGASAAALEFQLDPQFEERYDAAARVLVLEGRSMSYTVRCAAPPGPAELRAILDYCDWAARLNHALQPEALYPAARIALDMSLRRRERIPTQVELWANFGSPLRLRAEHKTEWQLYAHDRRLINKWRRQLEDSKTKFVPFAEFQRTALAAKQSSRD